MRALSAVLLAALAAPVFGQYTYYFTDPMQSLQTADWTSSGSPLFTDFSGGYWGGYGGLVSYPGYYSSMVSSVAVPDGTSSYGVRATLNFPSGTIIGTVSLLLRASSTFSSNGMPNTGYVVTFYCASSGGYISTTKIVNGTVTTLATTSNLSCSSGMTVRTNITDNGQIISFVNDVFTQWVQDSSPITSGKPGIVLSTESVGGTPYAVVSQVQLGPADRIAPGPIPTNGITYSVYANQIDFQWQAVPDDPNGSGVCMYQILRNDNFAENTTGYNWGDTTVQPGTEYSYTFLAFDKFFNGVEMTVNITTPVTPGGATPTPSNGQRVGVRSAGAYWGASPEHIDVLSGNVNYTIPILKALARTGWGVGFNIAYNSQNWRSDSGGLWNLGEDVGYGYGWKLLAGSLTPIWSPDGPISYYSYVDSTGATYRLNQNNGGIWTSVESIYVTYNANTNKLYFRDGSFWMMGCTSATSEPDSGTMYPTTIEDTNGNQIFITYQAGMGLGGNNSSARITVIQDVRGSYSFTYNSDTPHHLTFIQNTVGTGEKYSFTYSTLSLQAPFSPYTSYGSVSVLNNVWFNTLSQQYYFAYSSDNSGTLQSSSLPAGGELVWSYRSVTYGNGATFREISSRELSTNGSTYTTYPFTYGASPGYSTNQYTMIADPGGVGEKEWTFSQTGANTGMVTEYQGLQLPGPVTKTQNTFTWSQDSPGNLYISSTLTTLDPGQTYQAQKRTDQNVDIYGNVLNLFQYDYGNLTTPSRIYTYTYLNSSAYTSRYIYNRLTQATLGVGSFNVVTLATNTYDGTFSTAPSGVTNWDSSYASVTARGDIVSSTAINNVSSATYDQTGNVTSSTVNGVMTTVTSSSSTNYAAPSQLTVGTLANAMTWSSFLGLASTTGPNGDSATVSYDTSARPSTSTSPYGAVTTYAYSTGPYSSTNPSTTKATTNGHWTNTILDGLGRTITVQTGYSSTTLSQTDTVYGSCACSPTGKMIQQSLPHAPTAQPVWTTYTYDGIGRTVSVLAPDGASTTTYSYQGNTVTVTDPAGKWKTFTMDAFGHLTQVAEPNPAGGSNYVTSYTYDAWDNLSQVSMPRPSGTQTRTFTYNGKLLMSATNPENGTVTYTYNSYNKVATKTDAKGQVFTYGYDTLARLGVVSVGGNELETYIYDTTQNSSYPNYSQGRLTAATYGGGQFTETYGYSPAGEKTNKGLLITRNLTEQGSDGNGHYGSATADLESSYVYDSEGRMTSIQYPNSIYLNGNGVPTTLTGANLGYGYDTMERLSTMTNLATSTQIITGSTYDPANRLLTISGNSSLNESRSYNVMGQLTQITSSPYFGTNVNITYNYSSTQNNGKITSQTDNISGEQVVYAYDALNRLASAGATSNTWGQSYSYDGFGNLQDQTVTAGTAPALSVVYNAATNRQTTDCADANGNVLGGTGCGYPYTYSYDAKNRIGGVNLSGGGTAGYAYAPDNKRVWRVETDINNNTTLDEVTFWSVTGQRLATYNMIAGQATYTDNNNNGGQGLQWVLSLYATQSTGNVYFGGKLIANNTGNVGQDRLGSIGKFYPWGQEKPSATTNGTEKFTAYFRDSETGLDYAKARYHQPGMGRFLTPDPYMAKSRGAQNPSNPGSWNQYAYVAGDPVNYYDPVGEYLAAPPISWEPSPTPTEGSPGFWSPDPEAPPGGGGGGADPASAQFPLCDTNKISDQAVAFVATNYKAAATEAAAIQAWMPTVADSNQLVQFNQAALTLAFLDMGATESGWGASTNYFGWSGTIPSSAAGSFGGQLGWELQQVPSTASNPNPGQANYASFLILALTANTNASSAQILQALANAGWNPSSTYGSGAAAAPVQTIIDCLQQNYANVLN